MFAQITQEEFDKLTPEFQAEYKKQSDGKFIINVESRDSNLVLENVTGLKQALSTERTRANTAESALAKFEGLDPEAAREALEKVTDFGNLSENDKVKDMLAQQAKKLQEKHGTELTAKEAREKVLMDALSSAMIDSNAKSAIIAADGNPDLLLPIVSRFCKLEESDGNFSVSVLDEDGTPRITQETGKTDPMKMDEFVKVVLKNDPRYQDGFKGSGARGGIDNDKPSGDKKLGSQTQPTNKDQSQRPTYSSSAEAIRAAREQANAQ